jgi:hypothetical protein
MRLSVRTLANDLFVGLSLLSFNWVTAEESTVGGDFLLTAQFLGLTGLVITTGWGLIKEVKVFIKFNDKIGLPLIRKQSPNSPEDRILHYGGRLATVLSTLTADTVSLVVGRKNRIWQIINLGLFMLVLFHEAKITLKRAQKSKAGCHKCWRGGILIIMTCLTAAGIFYSIIDKSSNKANTLLLCGGLLSFSLLINESARAWSISNHSQDGVNTILRGTDLMESINDGNAGTQSSP